MRIGTSLTWMFILLFCISGCSNLVVRNLDVTWDQTNKTARAEIANIGYRDAGNFLVYFNGDENPVSQNHRPQVRHNVPGLARGDSVVLETDFAPLAHPDNNNLENVYKITVIADPKNMVKESNENDNSKDATVGCVTANSDIATGITGIQHPGQSFNETRAVDVTVISPTDRIVESLTLEGLNAGANAQVGARIYDGSTQMLTASSDVTVSAGSGITVTIPLTATLVSGRSYRIGFYVQTNPLSQASGNLFQPDSIPYTETTGIFKINSAHAIGSDSFPANPNIFVPKINIRTCELGECANAGKTLVTGVAGNTIYYEDGPWGARLENTYVLDATSGILYIVPYDQIDIDTGEILTGEVSLYTCDQTTGARGSYTRVDGEYGDAPSVNLSEHTVVFFDTFADARQYMDHGGYCPALD